MEAFYARNSLDDSRRQMILQRLERERELRRKHIKDGTIDQFELEDITEISSATPQQQNMFYGDRMGLQGMKDPSQILMNSYDDHYDQPDDDEPYQISPDNEYNRRYEYDQPRMVQNSVPYGQFGYNPESLYDPQEARQSAEHFDVNKENMRQAYNTQEYQHIDEEQLRKTKQKFHERLSKHRFVTNSGAKKCNRQS